MTPTTTGTRSRPATSSSATGPASRGGGRSIDPRISARRSAVTRQQGRRRLRILMIGLLGTAVLVGLWFVVAHTALLAARAVTVVGDTHETSDQVITAAGLAWATTAARCQHRRGRRGHRGPALGTHRRGERALARRRAHRHHRGDPPTGRRPAQWAVGRLWPPTVGCWPTAATQPPGLLVLHALDAARAGGLDAQRQGCRRPGRRHHPAGLVRGPGDGGHGRARGMGPAGHDHPGGGRISGRPPSCPTSTRMSPRSWPGPPCTAAT